MLLEILDKSIQKLGNGFAKISINFYPDILSKQKIRSKICFVWFTRKDW